MASRLHKTESMLSLEREIEHHVQVKAQIVKLQNESEQLDLELATLQDRIKKLATGVISLRHLVPMIALEKVKARKKLVLVEGGCEIMPLRAKEENVKIEPKTEGRNVIRDPADKETEAE